MQVEHKTKTVEHIELSKILANSVIVVLPLIFTMFVLWLFDLMLFSLENQVFHYITGIYTSLVGTFAIIVCLKVTIQISLARQKIIWFTCEHGFTL